MVGPIIVDTHRDMKFQESPMGQVAPALAQRIESLLSSDRVVLFMKGTRQQPRCGFSATVVEMLDELLPGYTTVDVLADPEIRDGIKVWADWPTIPQLYISGELVGGADITKDLYASGELHRLLGVERQAPEPVTVRITPAAAGVLKGARDQEPAEHRFLRVGVNGRFQHSLSFGPALAGDVACESEGIAIRLDPQSAKRADGVVIDWVTSPQSGFRIENPNEPPRVRQIGVKELKARMDATTPPLRLYDVRTLAEWTTARVATAVLVNDGVRAEIAALPKDTPLYFMCHHGGRSQTAAESFLRLGFKAVYNVEGGIDAWSQQVDPSVPRY
jgi:monothiol glutaredoxin